MNTRNFKSVLAGISIGHAENFTLGSGVTAILFDDPAVASCMVLGGAPGGRDTGLLELESTLERVVALVLSGGSTYGLDAAGGVQAALREAGRGTAFAGLRLPLVSQAIIFDLMNGGDKNWGRYSPYCELGYAAAMAASGGAFALGSIGAGTGATTPTVKGGLGAASATTESGHSVLAIAVVNAVGTPLIGSGPHFWAAPFEVEAEFGGLGWPAQIAPADLAPRLKGRPQPATTIGVILTDAVLTKPQAKRLAIMAHDGLARAILPAHAPWDGDTIFAAATGKVPLGDAVQDLTLLGHAATLAFARAIGRGVFEAAALPYPGALPSWRDRFGG
jgi:L-aminopeptidase/D-esterase-like protein